MAKRRKRGFAFHCHHKALIEWCWDYDGRVEFIKFCKPPKEQPLRQRLFKRVKGKLPAAVVEAGLAYDKVWMAYNKAGAAYYVRAAYDKAETAHDKARAVLEKVIQANMPAIEKLHAKECKNCPWDGKTIFGKTK